MGKAKRHEKSQKKHISSQSSKSRGQIIRRRQHSQNGQLNKSATATVLHKISNGNTRQQVRHKVPFGKDDRVLLIGEGDFSFALSLAGHQEVGTIVATSYDSEVILKEKYPHVNNTLRALLGTDQTKSIGDQARLEVEDEWNGFSSTSDDDDEPTTGAEGLKTRYLTILHGIDATSLSKSHRKVLSPHAPFTKIVFNFPHTGGLSTDVNRQVRANQELLVNFFNAAKPLLATKARPAKPVVVKEDRNEDEDVYDENGEEIVQESGREQVLSSGQILVTLFEGEPYTLWNIRDLARHCGLQVIESFKFPWAAYPGYKHARTVGDIVTGKDRSDEGKRKGAWRGEERDARCYVLGMKGEVVSAGGGKRKRGADESDESD